MRSRWRSWIGTHCRSLPILIRRIFIFERRGRDCGRRVRLLDLKPYIASRDSTGQTHKALTKILLAIKTGISTWVPCKIAIANSAFVSEGVQTCGSRDEMV